MPARPTDQKKNSPPPLFSIYMLLGSSIDAPSWVKMRTEGVLSDTDNEDFTWTP